ncbi:hypothetical protein N7495_009517 [Penicillium taxi]|uniref:uncharacterized protein n=1 Tax=Penicillium taxi TaxID=168475 RepID=UPI0025450737|nr:uncharacterized protein N7495_009517 [Penicillium taxi]KAJ5885007.1 hypothetical protein N7495_009517 [Penicillium taxi]
MYPQSSASPEPSSHPSGNVPSRSGSVKRARELLAAGVRPERSPQPAPANPTATTGAGPSQMQWPLPASGLQVKPHPKLLPTRSPPPTGPLPPRPGEHSGLELLSSSVYSVNRQESERKFVNTSRNSARTTPSFSQPKYQQARAPRQAGDSVPISPTSTVRTDYTIELPEPHPRQQSVGLVPPHARRHPGIVSPIQEERNTSRQNLASMASSHAMPVSWGSGPPGSEVVGIYMEKQQNQPKLPGSDESPESISEEFTHVRSASVGKRGKPTVRTISRSNHSSEVLPAIPNIPDLPSLPAKAYDPREKELVGLAIGTQNGPSLDQSNPGFHRSSTSLESAIDPEKPRIAKDEENPYIVKSLELPKAAPTLSDMRPGSRRPPRLDLDAVRTAESRGSLSSLTDLIRRATKLASNLDRGKTASRIDPDRDGITRISYARSSGSISDILASFPNPVLTMPARNGSWPIFFGRGPNQYNVEPLYSHEDGPNSKKERKCCGIPKKWFIFLSILLFVIIVLAVLLPVFLIAVPHQKANESSCATKNPCHNGGFSVSSGTICACVCSNGYTGSQCTTAGDSSCVTSQVNNSTSSRSATMGSSLPDLFSQSDSEFGISLDTITIMAMFSMNNLSCQTENALVAFSDVQSIGSRTKRSIELPLEINVGIEASSTPDLHDPNVVREVRSYATKDGILYDGDAGTNTTTTSSTNKSSSVPSNIVEFSKVAVLYIFQETGSFDTAQSSESSIQTYLVDSYNNVTHPSLNVGSFKLDFEKTSITKT